MTDESDIFGRESWEVAQREAAIYLAEVTAARENGDDAWAFGSLNVYSRIVDANDYCFDSEDVRMAREYVAEARHDRGTSGS